VGEILRIPNLIPVFNIPFRTIDKISGSKPTAKREKKVNGRPYVGPDAGVLAAFPSIDKLPLFLLTPIVPLMYVLGYVYRVFKSYIEKYTQV